MQDLANMPAPLEPEGPWRHCFSYHPMNVEIAGSDGIYLIDKEGRRYIDASGGPMAINLPHNDPRMKAAIAKQMEDYAYVHPTVANPKRAELCAALAEISQSDLNTSYLVSGGSEAVESAMKIARQYHLATGNREKYKTISCYESYHGMTLGTQALSGNPRSMAPFEPMLPKWPHVAQYSDHRRPEGMSRDDWGRECASELERAIHFEGAATVSAFIATPVGCGPDYGLFAPKTYWQEVRRICSAYDVLLIADEVVTGFGRTGTWFAMEHFAVDADLVTVAKGIFGCYVPLGAVLVSDRVNEPFSSGTNFIHGFTYGGHPLACAAGLTAIDILKEDRLIENAQTVGTYLHAQADRLTAHPSIADVRGRGLLMVMELVEDKDTGEYFDVERQAEKLFQALALKNGLVFYGTLYGPQRQPLFRRGLPMWIAPPLSISQEQIDDLLSRLDQTLTEWEEALGVA